MNSSEQRKGYIKHFYSKIWPSKRIKYGFCQYDKDLIELVRNTVPSKVLDVAIGDGEPYSKMILSFVKDLYGVDIAPSLIEIVKNSLPDIKSILADAEQLPFDDNYFDTVYCFRSMWYFPDQLKAVQEMIRVVKIGGYVVFDVQNNLHPIHQKQLETGPIIYDIIKKYSKNFIKIVLRPYKKYYIDWGLYKNPSWMEPTNIKLLNKFLNLYKLKLSIYGVLWSGRESSNTLKLVKGIEFRNYDRLVYLLKKQAN